MKLTKTIFKTLALLFFAANLHAQYSSSHTITWDATPAPVLDTEGNELFKRWSFEGGVHGNQRAALPYFSTQIQVPSKGNLKLQLVDAQYEPMDLTGFTNIDFVTEEVTLSGEVFQSRNDFFAVIDIMPVRKLSEGSYERLVSFTINVEHLPVFVSANAKGDPTYNSVLEDGTIYKIEVNQTGVYKLTSEFLSNAGITLSSINPKQIKIYGNGGGAVPELIATERYDDLKENAIFVSGENDGSFDSGDYILFYGEGANTWQYDAENSQFNRPMNIYDTKNYYFLKIDSGDGIRVANQASVSGEFTTTTGDGYARIEDETYNLLNESNLNQGSGRLWVGDFAKLQRVYDYTIDAPNIVTTEPVNLDVRYVGRSLISSTFFVTAEGQTSSKSVGSISTWSDANSTYARTALLESEFTPEDNVLNIQVNYPQAGDRSEGYLDFIQVNYRQQLAMNGSQFGFRDQKSLDYASTNYEVTGANANTVFWNVTNSEAPQVINGTLSGSTYTFGANSETLQEFVAFDRTAELLSPVGVTTIDNQNVHGIDNVDMVVVYFDEVLPAAEQFAAHRSAHSGLDIALVHIDDIYNEFSSGRKDATAIRDMAKMLYDRNDRFKYLLLMGDASYDFKNIEGQGNGPIPTFESYESFYPVDASPSDDYFTLLSEDEGKFNLAGMMDISVGRFPVTELSQATAIVNKIINYDTNPATLGDWRNRMLAVADDGERAHIRDNDGISNEILENNPNLNYDKIYIDAFQQEATSGGQRVPLAVESLEKNIFKGVLAVTYLGHGGAKGWTQERVLRIPQIKAWSNMDKLPVFITATCSFAGFDDPGFLTAGELVMLNESGGAIALFTTTRAVYAFQNATLTRGVTDLLFTKEDNEVLTLGDVSRRGKNNVVGTSTGQILDNTRKFMLIGDPSMKLALPKYNVATNTVNGIDFTQQLDTLNALSKVTITGEVQGYDGELMSNFNGFVFPTIYDKSKDYTTFGDEGTPVFDFKLQKNVIFKGKASVTEVYMNDESFVFGGITSDSPTLLVKLADDLGLNVVGNSIGHDLLGTLDDNTQSTILLNDFYESELNDYTKGTVRFPMKDLADGLHTIRVKAWDVANNPGEGFTEFVVANNAAVALERVLNYPNPFTTNTCFQFETNQDNREVDVMVQIFTVSGRLVKTLNERIFLEGSRLGNDNCIAWNGTDDFGDPLAKGVYLYKIKINSPLAPEAQGQVESDFEKLVILR